MCSSAHLFCSRCHQNTITVSSQFNSASLSQPHPLPLSHQRATLIGFSPSAARLAHSRPAATRVSATSGEPRLTRTLIRDRMAPRVARASLRTSAMFLVWTLSALLVTAQDGARRSLWSRRPSISNATAHLALNLRHHHSPHFPQSPIRTQRITCPPGTPRVRGRRAPRACKRAPLPLPRSRHALTSSFSPPPCAQCPARPPLRAFFPRQAPRWASTLLRPSLTAAP